MSFVTNSCQQLSLDDSTAHLTDRERRFLDKSWGTYFADHVFPYIDEQMFSVLYSDNKVLNNELISPLFCRLSSPFWKENTPENSYSGSQTHAVFSTSSHSDRIKTGGTAV